MDAANKLLDRIGLKPSIIVHTGHGIQAYWLLKEFWAFDNPVERHQAATLSRRWVSTIQAVAMAQGYDVDAVGDLTRVFRLPGTTNRKADPVPVEIISADADLRYGVDDFDPFLVAEEFEPGTGTTVNVGALTLRADAEPPALKLLASMENDTKFKKTWHRLRTDLQDQSPSAYDMSLASLAVAGGWKDQEIADLIIASRPTA